MNLNKVIRENLIKNAILIALMIFLGIFIHSYIENGILNERLDIAGNILSAVSIISVLAGFACFGFQYEKVDLRNSTNRYFAHVLTGMMLFVIGTCLLVMWQLLILVMGHFLILDLVLLILYLACVGFDYWDLSSACKGQCKIH